MKVVADGAMAHVMPDARQLLPEDSHDLGAIFGRKPALGSRCFLGENHGKTMEKSRNLLGKALKHGEFHGKSLENM